MVKGGSSHDDRSQRPNSKTPSILARQERSTSPQAASDASPSLRRSQRLEGQQSARDIHGRDQAIVGTQSTPSTQSHEVESASGISAGGARSVAESALPEIPSSGTIVVSLDRRPPLEVRTGISIPRLTVRVIITDSEPPEPPEPTDPVPTTDFGTLHAVISLWSADGQVASPHAVPPMLTGRKDATLANVVSSSTSERRAEATFSDLAITWPGHYRIRISIMETPLPGRDEDSDDSIRSPRQLLSIETQPIHAHGFAPLELTQ